MIEKVMINVTLKAGKNVWEKGAVLTAPLPPDILDEVYKKTGNVIVVSGDEKDRTRNKLVFVAQRVQENASTMTTMQPAPEPVSKPKPKLNRRRR